jgi:hypothetical protein
MAQVNAGTAGTGGTGGGANGNTADAAGNNATANTGGGGGAASGSNTGGSGGSGIVILKYPREYSVGGGSGLTFSTSISGVFKITSFTAGTGTISFSKTA